ALVAGDVDVRLEERLGRRDPRRAGADDACRLAFGHGGDIYTTQAADARWSRNVRMNSSMSPSSTASTLPTLRSVRWSATWRYGARTYERIWLPHSMARFSFSNAASFSSCSRSLRS